MTCCGRPTSFTRNLQTGKAATLLNFGRYEIASSLLTARRAVSNLFLRRAPRLPGARRPRAPRRARLPMRRCASRTRRIYNRVHTPNDVVGISGRKQVTESRLSCTSSAAPKFELIRTKAGPRHRGRASEHQPYGEDHLGSRSVRTSGSRPSTSCTVVSFSFVDPKQGSTILLTARGGLIHGA